MARAPNVHHAIVRVLRLWPLLSFLFASCSLAMASRACEMAPSIRPSRPLCCSPVNVALPPVGGSSFIACCVRRMSAQKRRQIDHMRLTTPFPFLFSIILPLLVDLLGSVHHPDRGALFFGIL